MDVFPEPLPGDPAWSAVPGPPQLPQQGCSAARALYPSTRLDSARLLPSFPCESIVRSRGAVARFSGWLARPRGGVGGVHARVETQERGRTGARTEDGRAMPELADPSTTWGFDDRRTSTRVRLPYPLPFPFSTLVSTLFHSFPRFLLTLLISLSLFLLASFFFLPLSPDVSVFRSPGDSRTLPHNPPPFSSLRLFPPFAGERMSPSPVPRSFFTDRPVVFSRPFNLSFAAGFLHTWTGLGHRIVGLRGPPWVTEA